LEKEELFLHYLTARLFWGKLRPKNVTGVVLPTYRQ